MLLPAAPSMGSKNWEHWYWFRTTYYLLACDLELFCHPFWIL
jgi:hypothetical protein